MDGWMEVVLEGWMDVSLHSLCFQASLEPAAMECNEIESKGQSSCFTYGKFISLRRKSFSVAQTF
jgi:hypothetical protein